MFFVDKLFATRDVLCRRRYGGMGNFWGKKVVSNSLSNRGKKPVESGEEFCDEKYFQVWDAFHRWFRSVRVKKLDGDCLRWNLYNAEPGAADKCKNDQTFGVESVYSSGCFTSFVSSAFTWLCRNKFPDVLHGPLEALNARLIQACFDIVFLNCSFSKFD